MTARSSHSILIEVALERLGRDLKTARVARNEKLSVWAERAGCSVNTIKRIERGEGASVGFGVFVSIFRIIGKESDLLALADPDKDAVAKRLIALEARKRPGRPRAKLQ